MGIDHNSLKQINSDIIHFSSKTKLIIVTKNRSEIDVSELLSLGYQAFGENRVQEAKLKFSALRNNHSFKLHLLGPLQTNKTSLALSIFDTIQSIDRVKLVNEIKKLLDKEEIHCRTKNFFIQVNIGNEPQKSGIKVEECKDFYFYCKDIININGLMCIPPIDKNPQKYFEKMIDLRNQIDSSLKLSMGMSADYQEALKQKADYIRVGSKLFL